MRRILWRFCFLVQFIRHSCEGLFIMRYVAAYLLAVLGGNEKPSVDDIKKILGSVGIEADMACLKKVISELSGKSINDLIAEGKYMRLKI